jgi:hypothetical protein
MRWIFRGPGSFHRGKRQAGAGVDNSRGGRWTSMIINAIQRDQTEEPYHAHFEQDVTWFLNMPSVKDGWEILFFIYFHGNLNGTIIYKYGGCSNKSWHVWLPEGAPLDPMKHHETELGDTGSSASRHEGLLARKAWQRSKTPCSTRRCNGGHLAGPNFGIIRRFPTDRIFMDFL